MPTVLDTDFARRMVKRLEDEYAERATLVLAGNLDGATYKSETGYMRGLADVKSWVEEIEKQMREGK